MNQLSLMSQKILDQLPTLQRKKILIFGDVGIDEYVEGHVGRISPEAPVPVVEVKESTEKLGLSANVAANVKSLGGTPWLVSFVGQDKGSETLKSLLSEREISSDFLITDSERPTTSKLRVMSGQHHIVRVDYETKSPLSPSMLDKAGQQVESLIADCDGVVIQDYAKGMISEQSCQMIIEKAKAHGKKVIVDPYRNTPLTYYKGAHFMTPNRDEAFELAKQIPNHEVWNDVDRIGPELMKMIEGEKMVITLGPEGMKIFNGKAPLQLPTFARKVFDVTGAGDTVISAFSLAVAAGWEIEMAGYLANLAAGVVVAQVGAVACTTEALKDYVNSLS
ncbi:MAG: D-glycero-beta-D-manno-heptose-7-phosphate kinase [Bdellovibrionales bacterium]|nr:bifunctional ADP-heptose synthase [Bdellovibrionales bacterium]NQZ19487.1 D-glycero-beta-D-manno-heptose-7-phosphate kinase [Bdellovibrionales bacterium]